ncbi:unnamed protein product [Paramecium sonneborni]|uniref:Uncharacterized protein n=1 Tax=Paramecium sonneborni TaxID=65129 RepID=A0A8S1RS91_9CILI|nr:unnamed protein product [Paramecium sonneborni]
MNFSPNWKEQIFEKEIKNWNKQLKRIEKVKIQIKFTKDHQIIYSKDGSNLRIEKHPGIINYPNLFNNMDQIVNLQWSGQYDQNNKKNGKWIASWNEEDILKNVGGYYKDGQKQGFWKDLFLNFWNKGQVLETGEYQNGFRIGNWNYICYYKKIRGGFYNKDGYKQGKWVEFDEGFYNGKQIAYHGEYDIKEIINKCNIILLKEIQQFFSGGGQYDQEGSEKKIGKWVELDETFYDDKQITYIGEYNLNGSKVGQWDVIFQYKQIGGGQYNQEGGNKKVGNWVELEDGFNQHKQVTYIGEYNFNGCKVGQWDVIFQYKQIGGGQYDKDGSDKKFGKWVELDDGFNQHKQVTYIGDYNINGKKVGRWDIWLRKEQIFANDKNDNVGGGEYDQEGFQKKIGKWAELDESFNYYKQFIYIGDYNMNGMKTGVWNKINLKFNSLCGCVNFDENGNEIYRSENNAIIYVGEFNMNKKVGRWQIMFDKRDEKFYKQVHIYVFRGGGLYKLEGSEKKTGQWVELDEKFYDDKQVTYIGEYNLNGSKVGRWDIWFQKKNEEQTNDNMQIIFKYKEYNMRFSGGGSYDQEGSQKKFGKWIELDEGFQFFKQVTYIGEYNINGMKQGRWDIWFQKTNGDMTNVNIGGGSYEGEQNKIGRWVELDKNFWLGKQVIYNGEYNMKGMKIGTWVEIDIKENVKLSEKKYDI